MLVDVVFQEASVESQTFIFKSQEYFLGGGLERYYSFSKTGILEGISWLTLLRVIHLLKYHFRVYKMLKFLALRSSQFLK